MSHVTGNSTSAEANVRRSMVGGGIIAAQAEVAQQQEAIRELAAENEKLKKEIAAVSGVPYDYVKADKYATLKGEVDALERRYQFEKMKKNELTKKYQLARIDLLQSRRLKGGVNAERENAEAVQRQVEILENRLDQALTNFNDAISYNKELRDHIDIIREERRVFQRVYKKMEDDLRAKKKLMSERIEQSNKDLDERDGYLRQVEQLQKAIKEQRQEYDGNVRELDAAMAEIKELREEQQQLQLELEARDYEFENDPDNLIQISTMNSTEIAAKVREALEEAQENSRDDKNDVSDTDYTTEQEPNLNEIMQQLVDFAPDGDLNKVVKQYETLGEINFSLYKHINELTTSREEMEHDIRTLKTVIAEEHDNEAQQQRLIKELEERLAETESLLERLQSSVIQHREVLAGIRSVTEEVFHQIGCTTDGVKDQLGGVDQCTESNHLKFLGLIEERATMIICAYQRRQHFDSTHAELVAQRKAVRALTGPDTAANNANANTTAIPPNEVKTSHNQDDNLKKDSSQHAEEEEEENALTATADSQKDETEDAVNPTTTKSPTPTGGAAGTTTTTTVIAPANTTTTTDTDIDTALPETEDIAPFLPVVRGRGQASVNAVRLVRQACLPSAHLGGEEVMDVTEEGDGDPVVSHEEIRRQMEQRLVSRREREERAQRRRRELKEQLNAVPVTPRKK
ncbi:putative outer dynein arm docking complex [Trypanosoma theileri]|uniref:Putative outer dynein arm docking complex n=1 Tax=Trypanosoma theileri TaxID=67003 RepID=A0A1X0NRP3_9TRYP|nr:putative outer dynein arm docking complex [Trypanosoma theileri]ORC87372.1 putative outer dynein arm docking complex [Trypanosoma theileri]